MESVEGKGRERDGSKENLYLNKINTKINHKVSISKKQKNKRQPHSHCLDSHKDTKPHNGSRYAGPSLDPDSLSDCHPVSGNLCKPYLVDFVGHVFVPGVHDPSSSYNPFSLSSV